MIPQKRDLVLVRLQSAELCLDQLVYWVELLEKRKNVIVAESVVLLMSIKYKISFLFSILLISLSIVLCGCTSSTSTSKDDSSNLYKSSYSNDSSSNNDYIDSNSSYDDSVNDNQTYEETNYCEADGCYKKGVKEYVGISGKTEYYCNEHYQEIMDIYSSMEEDVGGGSYSTHTCEVCDKEGTYSIIGFSGNLEYYCTEHYYEMKDLLESLE